MKVRSALQSAALTTKNMSRVRVLSGGEQAVRLCKLMNRETNVSLLDEPTNHLDVDAKDELRESAFRSKAVLLIATSRGSMTDWCQRFGISVSGR